MMTPTSSRWMVVSGIAVLSFPAVWIFCEKALGMSPDDSSAIAGALVAVAVLPLAAWASSGVPPNAEIRQVSLESRLADLGDLMKSSARVLEEVQAEIQTRIVLAEKAKSDAEDAERLADLNEAQRLALARLVKAELSSEVDRAAKKSFWQGFLTNSIFFALGVIASIATTMVLK